MKTKRASLYRTKPFMSGRSQAIRIPKERQLDRNIEVVVNRVGSSLVITPCTVLQDDFMDDGRPKETPSGRTEF